MRRCLRIIDSCSFKSRISSSHLWKVLSLSLPWYLTVLGRCAPAEREREGTFYSLSRASCRVSAWEESFLCKWEIVSSLDNFRPSITSVLFYYDSWVCKFMSFFKKLIWKFSLFIYSTFWDAHSTYFLSLWFLFSTSVLLFLNMNFLCYFFLFFFFSSYHSCTLCMYHIPAFLWG